MLRPPRMENNGKRIVSVFQQHSIPRVVIVVLNYKNYSDTVECLQSLSRITYQNVETIIVDNDSQNGSMERICQSLSGGQPGHAVIAEDAIETSDRNPEQILLVQAASNRGYAAGNNLGMRVALKRGADYILLLNNDTQVEPGFLEPLVAFGEGNPRMGAVGPKILDVEGRIEPGCARRRPTLGYYLFGDGVGRRLCPNNRWRRRHFYKGEYAYDCPKEIDILSGSCMLIKRAVIEQVGLLDENTFLYLEEFILHEKMRQAGWLQAIVPESVIVHKGGQSASQAVPEHIRKAKRESRRYYLEQYRQYGRLLLWVVELSRSRPPAIVQKFFTGKNNRKTEAVP